MGTQTYAPTEAPTLVPTHSPTDMPTNIPTVTPTEEPTATPTTVPTEPPTAMPTATPTEVPTFVPVYPEDPDPVETDAEIAVATSTIQTAVETAVTGGQITDDMCKFRNHTARAKQMKG